MKTYIYLLDAEGLFQLAGIVPKNVSGDELLAQLREWMEASWDPSEYFLLSTSEEPPECAGPKDLLTF